MTLSHTRFVLPSGGGQRKTGRDETPSRRQSGHEGPAVWRPPVGEQMGWGDLEPPVGTSELGCCVKAARAGIILNNNYSYCLLSTYYLPKTVQRAFRTFNLLVLPAAPCEDGETEAQRSDVTGPSSHSPSWQGRNHMEQYLPSQLGFLGTFPDSKKSPVSLLFHCPFPTQPIPWTTEGGSVHCGSQPHFHLLCPS